MNTIKIKQKPELNPEVEYAQCPFCDKIFAPGMVLVNKVTGDRTGDEMDEHIVKVHDKVRVRKGTNYKWMDRAEVKRLLKEP